MFERFTDRARRVVVLAQEERARLLNHNHIGTEHLLLGLLHEGEGVAASALVAMGVELDVARTTVEEIVGAGASSPSGHIPFTTRAKKALELSLREALQLGHSYIGTEHLLLGLIREGQGVAMEVLAALHVDPEDARQQVLALVAGLTTEGRPAVAHLEGTGPAMPDPDEMAVARNGLLRRMIADEGTLLSRGLREHGIEPEDFLATLDRLADGG